MKTIVLIIINLFWVVSLNASNLLSLDSCQNMASKNYPLTQKYKLLEQTSEYSVENLKKGWLPQVSAFAQATLQSDVNTWPPTLQSLMEMQDNRKMEGMHKDQYKIGLDVNQLIWDGGLIKAQKKILSAQHEIQSSQVNVDLYALRERVNDLFFGILLMNRKIELTNDLIVVLDANQSKLTSLMEGGLVLEGDVSAIKAEKIQAQQQLKQLKCTETSFLQLLSLFCGINITDVEQLELPQETELTTEFLRPELQMLDAQLALYEAQNQLITSKVMPFVSFFAQGFYGYPGYNLFDSMYSHDWSFNGILGARIQWNISNFYTMKGERQKLNLQRDMTQNNREVFLFNSQLQLSQAQDNINLYRQLLNDDDEIILLRSSVRESAEAKIEHGVANVDQLLSEIQKENQAKLNKTIHEIELLKFIYEQKTITNH